MRRGGAPSAGVVLNGGADRTNRGGSYGQFVLGIDRGFVIIGKAHDHESAERDGYPFPPRAV